MNPRYRKGATKKLSTRFENDLEKGTLSPIFERVRKDDTLDLEIRKGYINIYYRGGSIAKIEENAGGYISSFDKNYIAKTRLAALRGKAVLRIFHSSHADIWVENIPTLKNEMDLFLTKKPKLEREIQQHITRINNRSPISNETDYFITDIEYSVKIKKKEKEKNARFDMVALRWDATPDARKRTKADKRHPDLLRIAFIENKFGDNALDEGSGPNNNLNEGSGQKNSLNGGSGLKGHLEDFSAFIKSRHYKNHVARNILYAYNFKFESGLISCRQKASPISLSTEKPELIFLIANHKPSNGKLRKVLNSISPPSDFDLRFIFANFMGYGLYSRKTHSLDEVKKRL